MTVTNLPARRTAATVTRSDRRVRPASRKQPKRRLGVIGWFVIALIVVFFTGLMLSLGNAA